MEAVYLPPGALYKQFTVQRRTTALGARAERQPAWTDTGTLSGILAEASPQERERWKQMQHPVTHVIAAQGAALAEPGDRLALGSRRFHVQAVDDTSGLGLWTLYRCEERQGD